MDKEKENNMEEKALNLEDTIDFKALIKREEIKLKEEKKI